MEGPPNSESLDITDLTTEGLVDIIKTRGIEDSEVRDTVGKWIEYQEELVARVNTSKATIMLNINRADLYLATGDFAGAWKDLEEAREQAFQENEDNLYQTIMAKMDAIELRAA